MARPKKSRVKVRKERFLEAYEKSLGNVTMACKASDVGRTTFYKWLKTDNAFKEEVDSLDERTIDFAESELLKQIKEGNTTATIFYLKTKGKRRGYIEKQEVEHTGEVNNLHIYLPDNNRG
jgi:hypothetical protein